MKGYFDRERRRTKAEKRRNWATRLVKPLTFRALVTVGVVLTRIVYIIYRLSKVFRE